MGGTFPTALAQYHGETIYGDDRSQISPAIATRPTAAPMIVGNSFNGLFPATFRPFSFEESPLALPSTFIGYEFGLGNLRMLAAANSSSDTKVGVAGVCRPVTGTGDDAFFTDIGTNLADNLQQMLFFKVPGNDRPNKIIELQDNSFLMVGSNTSVTGNIGTSWIARISPRPDYRPIFRTTIGNPQGPVSAGEGAITVVQSNSKTLLVAGNTFQFSTGAEGSIYIAEMNMTGGLKSFHTYRIQNGVLKPKVTDMVLMPDGSLTLVGITNISGDPDHFGFVMTVTADLSSATFKEFSQPGNTTSGLTMNAAVLEPGTNNVYVAGMIQLPHGGTIKQSGLLMKIVPPIQPVIANSYDFFGGNEQFNGILFRDNNATIEAVGTADVLPPNIVGPDGTNIWTQRLNTDLAACRTQSVALQFDTKSVVHATVTPPIQQDTTEIFATLALSADPIGSLFPCAIISKMASGGTASKPASVTVTPMTENHDAKVKLDKEVKAAQVSLTHDSGKLISEWIMTGDELTMNLHGLPAGMYFVAVQQGDHQSTHKLLIP
ncbi:MAG: T9SS type A sorting domain-containing protein [Bacteroidia bacterium]